MLRGMIQIPEIVRMKPGALRRLGVYLARSGHDRVFVALSEGLKSELLDPALAGFEENGVSVAKRVEVTRGSMEEAVALLADVPADVRAAVGLGGGKALDMAKYLASVGNLAYYAVPTSLSNDGFCSPQSSLTINGRRRSLRTAMPHAVILDTEACLSAPPALWRSGVGDLAAKITAVADWKLAFHACGTPVNDFAALLSDATVYQFLADPKCDAEGVRRLGTALMLNGIAMEIAGSSRPASGSEHLISHALDEISARPRLHGLQVGVATYIVAHVQKNPALDDIARLFEQTGFWDSVASDPFSKSEWLAAVATAPHLKRDFFTTLSVCDRTPEIRRLLETDEFLRRSFVD
jgi:glycerol-1-phosphate dehydrogenase [NAD(P)+]